MMKILIVGCGRIFPKHLESISKLNSLFKLVGICDVDLKKRIDYSIKLKVPAFKLIEEAIDQTKPDIVSILTPSGLHALHAIKVLKKHIHVIIEKPMCLKNIDAKKIIHYSKKSKKKVFIVMQNKFNPPVVKLLKDIKLNTFGKVFHAGVCVKWKRDQSYYNLDKWRGSWKFDGGVVCNQASHHLDLLRTIMGDPISVIAKGFRHLNKIEAEDTAIILFRFKNNKSGIMEATTAIRPYNIEGSINIMGSKGSAKIGGFALNEISYYHSNKKININQYKTTPKNVYGFGHIEFYKHVYHCIKKKINSDFDAKKSSKTVSLINAIYKSIETNREIKLTKNINSKKLGI